MPYEIVRPPLAPEFEVPTREELLGLKVGDIVKVSFRAGEDQERMWIILTDRTNMHEWAGTLDNDPAGADMSQAIRAGDEVKFHPYDIIQIIQR